MLCSDYWWHSLECSRWLCGTWKQQQTQQVEMVLWCQGESSLAFSFNDTDHNSAWHPKLSSPWMETHMPNDQELPILPLPSLRQPLIYFLSLWIYKFRTFHINAIIKYVDEPLFLRIILSRRIHVVPRISASLLFVAESYSTVWIDHILFIHSPADGHCCFHFGYCDSTSLNFCVQFLLGCVTSSWLGGHTAVLCLAFWGTVKPPSPGAVPFHIPITDSDFSMFSPTLAIFQFCSW